MSLHFRSSLAPLPCYYRAIIRPQMKTTLLLLRGVETVGPSCSVKLRRGGVLPRVVLMFRATRLIRAYDRAYAFSLS